jgi:hypothetical protein
MSITDVTQAPLRVAFKTGAHQRPESLRRRCVIDVLPQHRSQGVIYRVR